MQYKILNGTSITGTIDSVLYPDPAAPVINWPPGSRSTIRNFESGFCSRFKSLPSYFIKFLKKFQKKSTTLHFLLPIDFSFLDAFSCQFKKNAIARKCLGRIRTVFQICGSKDPDPKEIFTDYGRWNTDCMYTCSVTKLLFTAQHNVVSNPSFAK